MNRNVMFLLAGFCLIGCLKTRAELRGETPDVSTQKQTVVAQRETRKQQPAQAPAANYHSPEETDEQLRILSGRIDTVENQLVQINAAHAGEKDGVNKEKQAFDGKFQAYEEALRKLEAQIHAMNEDIGKLRLAMERPEKPEKAEKAGKPQPNKAWEVGETLFAQKKFKEAILAYQKYRDANPKGKYYSDATYKMGVCFQEAGLKDEAKVFFDEVTNKFPGTKEAKKAAFRAKQIK